MTLQGCYPVRFGAFEKIYSRSNSLMLALHSRSGRGERIALADLARSVAELAAVAQLHSRHAFRRAGIGFPLHSALHHQNRLRRHDPDGLLVDNIALRVERD